MPDTKEDFIRERKIDVSNYENLLKALITFKKYIEENLHAKYFFGGKLKSEHNPAQTPDIIIELNDRLGLIGDAKRSLRKLFDKESKEAYIKNYIEDKIIKQLQKYDSSFDNFKLKEHDIILFVPQIDNEALGIIKFDYLDKNKPFNRKFAIITYSIELQANTKRILVKQDYGALSDNGLYDQLRRGINYYEGALTKELGKYKIYEENRGSTPIEYVMLILWDSIFNEIINSSQKESIIERYRQKENTFQVKLSKLMEYLKQMYTLPTYSNNDPSYNDKQQFKIEMVKEAMEIFCFINLAKIIDSSEKDILYEVTIKSLPEKDELSYFLGKIYEALKEKKSKPNSKGIEKLDKYFGRSIKKIDDNSLNHN
jgi:hypothetical protein